MGGPPESPPYDALKPGPLGASSIRPVDGAPAKDLGAVPEVGFELLKGQRHAAHCR